MVTMMRLGFAALVVLGAIGTAQAQDDGVSLVIGVQESGTVRWELEAIEALGLDEQHGVDLELRYLADSRAGQIALQSGAVDVILSDFVWVSVQRGSGSTVTMVPHSLAVGGLMVPADSDLTDVGDLAGTTIGVAGGPADKSWVVLQAYYADATGGTLAEDASARYGAPPLINELLGTGAIDAGLNFWQWNARLKADGMRELISVADMLEGLGIATQPPLLGWTFTEETAEAKGEALTRFLEASFDAKEALKTDDDVWTGLAALMGTEAGSALFESLRDDYRGGIVDGYDPSDVEAATAAYALMARQGGSEVVADQPTLAPGTFWQGFSR
jgi:NitT/TauT family transport system substrate-binding protein